jgi:DDE family transposase
MIGDGACSAAEGGGPSAMDGVLDLYRKAAPAEFFLELEQELKLNLKSRRRIFNLPLVVWLMMAQRWDAKATLSTSVQQVVQKRPAALLSDHKRIREGTVSAHTGAYSDARQEMPVEVANRVADRILEHLLQGTRREALPGWKRGVFVLDGSSVELPHTPELIEAYPPATNQHGESHWPVLRLLVAQELTSGLAQRPCWGPMYGPEAVSEQALTEQILDRLPESSVLMGDINFGVFSVAFAATQRRHDVLFRLQEQRGAALGRGLLLSPGTEQRVCWYPSAYERKQHPELPADACVPGRLIMEEVRASNGQQVILYFFTTLALEVKQLLPLYGDRWDVETDLRSLKQTLRLQTLRCQSSEMIAKELVLTIAGYNLVRAVMQVAAEEQQIDPRRLSFSRAQDVVNAALPGLDAARSAAEYQARLRRMFQLVASCKLPDRSRRPTTPREVWGHSCKFPKRKAAAKLT